MFSSGLVGGVFYVLQASATEDWIPKAYWLGTQHQSWILQGIQWAIREIAVDLIWQILQWIVYVILNSKASCLPARICKIGPDPTWAWHVSLSNTVPSVEAFFLWIGEPLAAWIMRSESVSSRLFCVLFCRIVFIEYLASIRRLLRRQVGCIVKPPCGAKSWSDD